MNSSDEKNLEENRRRQRDRIVAEIEKRAPGPGGVGCFLCKWILEDLAKNPKLTGYPTDANGASVFPRAGKIDHLKLEGLFLPT